MKYILRRKGKPLMRDGRIVVFDSHEEAMAARTWEDSIGIVCEERLAKLRAQYEK